VFKQYIRRRGLSHTDATTIAVMRELNVDVLLTYGLRSFAGIVDNIIGPGYWSSLPQAEKERISRISTT